MAAEKLFDLWSHHSVGMNAEASRSAFDELRVAYQSPGRFYHTLEHVADVLHTVELLSSHGRDMVAVRFAAWYHDAVYDPRANDNEERSADMARAALGRLGLSTETIDHVAALILATKIHQADDPDAALLLDADLAILGAEVERYDWYTNAIRQEYAWVPEADYRSGRAAILRRFLERHAIFRTVEMQQSHESRAKDNLRREIDRLTVAA